MINCLVAADSPDSVNRLMAGLRSGSPEAAGKLVELFYPELRRLAMLDGRRHSEGLADLGLSYPLGQWARIERH
jgi:hypothetical protein